MVYNLYKDTDSYNHSMVDNIVDSTVGTSLVAAGWWKSYR